MKKYILYFIAICIVCISCKPMNKSIGKREAYEYPSASSFKLKTLPSIHAILQQPIQIFNIDSDTILYGKEGTQIFIQPSCLRKTDSTLYNGKIKVELKELYSKEALLKERAVTISNGSMLESDGSLYIDARTESGEPLYIACENAVLIRLPREIQNNMTYFDGFRDAAGNMNWQLSGSIKPVLEEKFIELYDIEDLVNDGYNQEDYMRSGATILIETYFFSTKTFGWINCDRFYDDAREKTDLLATFVLPEEEKNIVETYNYIVFDSLMSVLPVYPDATGQWICPSLPVGETITCISIQKSAHRLYCGIQKSEVGRSGLLVQLKEINEQELKILLDLTL